MKQLLLLRHGHSGDKSSGYTDKERTLTIVGIQQASAVGIFLHDRNVNINTIISSSADRAVATANLVAERIRFNTDSIVVVDDLYNGSMGTYINVLGNCDNHQHLLLVGHNPTISYLAEYLTQSASGDMGPGDLLVLSLDIQRWNELAQGKAMITTRFSPTRKD
jgi:phosphohistidine phosphatase